MEAGRALDKLIAEKVFEYQTGKSVGWLASQDVIYLFPYEETDRWFSEGQMKIPNYSTSLEDAWQVVEKIHSIDEKAWLHLYFDESERFWGARFSDRLSFIQKETAPLAICLAALKVIES